MCVGFTGAVSADARDDLDAFSQGLKGLDGRFTQKVFDDRGQLKETSSGRVALSRPDLFRWEYTKPYPQLIVADGDKVWVHDPDLEQVTVREQGPEERNSPLAALLDPAQREQRFVISEAGTDDGLEWLKLTPKDADDANFRSARLGFGDDGLERMQVTDALGQRTSITFSQWRRNPDFGSGTFSFTPPAGADVIGDR
ncbi:MAG TPA: outer membrane lipoprotein chaperone LolA [Xanthomonadaceae bacterium]|nr:outer membrane lipoprotein chaperone LolA [Xanthomonadaceae bacterium]